MSSCIDASRSDSTCESCSCCSASSLLFSCSMCQFVEKSHEFAFMPLDFSHQHGSMCKEKLYRRKMSVFGLRSMPFQKVIPVNVLRTVLNALLRIWRSGSNGKIAVGCSGLLGLCLACSLLSAI